MRNTIKNALLLLELTYKQKGFSVSDKDKTTMSMIIDTWTTALRDLPAEAVGTAITAWIQTQTWPPTPADIRSMIITGGEKTATEAWEEVTTAIGKYGLFRGKKALESMSETTRKVVETMGWRSLCMSESIMTERAHFMRMYREISDKKAKQALMSPEVREAIKKTGGEISDGKGLLTEGN